MNNRNIKQIRLLILAMALMAGVGVGCVSTNSTKSTASKAVLSRDSSIAQRSSSATNDLSHIVTFEQGLREGARRALELLMQPTTTSRRPNLELGRRAYDQFVHFYYGNPPYQKDHEKAVQLLQEAAGQGSALAQFHLAHFLMRGEGLTRDEKAAAQWMCRAAEQGFAAAQFATALLYLQGTQLPRDPARAVELFGEALAQDEPMTQMMIGRNYASGTNGLPPDLDRAYVWLNLAAVTGYAEAIEAREKLTRRMPSRHIAAAQEESELWSALRRLAGVTSGVASQPLTNTPVVEVLATGENPKRLMRLTPKAGMEQKAVMTMQFDLDMSIGAKNGAAKAPAIRLPIDIQVTEAKADGDVHYSFKYGQAEIVEGSGLRKIGQAMKDALAELEGINFRMVASSRGLTKQSDIELPPKLDPESKRYLDKFKGSMEQVSVLWPEEPVGPGAKWRQTATINRDGLRLRQTTTYDLTALSGDIAHIAISVEQTANSQRVQLPDMPANAKADLLAHNAYASGKMQFDFGRLLPSQASLSMLTNSRLRVQASGERNEIAMKLALTVKIEDKPAINAVAAVPNRD